MKFSETWLREWVNPHITREELCEKLTMAGLEIESLLPVCESFSGVVVGHVLSVTKHPDADRLNVCEVDVGDNMPLTIVCGAANVRPHMKVAAALDKAVLPNNFNIKISKIRGVTSHGMLCSARELGLTEESEGLMDLPADAAIGRDVWEYLDLSDHVIDVSITPNRGDCLSRLGLAREVAALTECHIEIPEITDVEHSITDTINISVSAQEACPRYIGRVIRNVKANVPTPLWLRETLRRSGSRSINAIVDIVNYVMLELGQPMHAFDLAKIAGDIQVRLSAGESIKLLDGSEVKLDNDTLIIADSKNPLAIAGVMGGLDSGVTLETQDIFLESAFFTSAWIAKAGRRYKLNSDSSYRFERGIDPRMQRVAIERVSQLLLEIVGGEAGPIIEVIEKDLLPQDAVIKLRPTRLSQMIGCDIPDETVEAILHRLGFALKKSYDAFCWIVTVPARRSDITIEEDLIEEIARLYGYSNIPNANPLALLKVIPCPENKIATQTIRRALCDLAYHEVITYSFVDKKLQALLSPNETAIELVNPITADMGVMRTNLFPGLINTLMFNQNRQQSRVHIFETGQRFIEKDGQLCQERMLSGLVTGSAAIEQWGIPSRPVDFYDLKGDLENLFKLTLASDEYNFRPAKHPALHPGQSADLYYQDEFVGVLGALHPSIIQELKIDGKIYVFELSLEKLEMARVPRHYSLSKFPEIRRDIALLLDQAIPSQDIRYTIKAVAGELLQAVNIFDVYQGKGIAPGQKSIALSLTLQHSSRTLVDEEVADLMERVVVTLKERFNAELRG